MRTIGACFAVGAFAAIISSAPPSTAFGLSFGPFHVGLPFFGHRHRLVRHRHFAERRSSRRRAVYDKASPPDTRAPPRAEPTLLYPALAMPNLYDEIFWPERRAQWPFGYDAIFRTAFAKSPLDDNARACQQSDRTRAIVARIGAEVRPNRSQLPLLQKLGGALGAASGYMVKACPQQIPAESTARLNLMQSQIEALSMAIDLIRPPLQQFEQSLDKRQLARFAAMRSPGNACSAVPEMIDWSVDQIDQSVQPGDDQRQAVADLKQAFAGAAGDLHAHCPNPLPTTPLARLEAMESRLDASWRATLSMQVALSRFESHLTAQQRDRFQAMNLAEAR